LSFDTKMLYGNLQFPVAVGRGKGKCAGKAKVAQLNGQLINQLFFGQNGTAGLTADYLDTTGIAIPSSPYSITPTPPTSGVWTTDLGCRNAAGVALTRVASAPATGQYSVAAGVYTFAVADTGTTVYISYQYTAVNANAITTSILNLPMGYAPSFRADLSLPYNGQFLTFSLPNCVSSKMSFATKQDDFMVPEFDFEVFANSAGQLMTMSLSSK
jgi:hypothetical protein